MRRLVDVLGEPQRAYPVIHITGTNGKGSTAAHGHRAARRDGLTVGTYTSPHLERVNERIARNGEPIDDDDLAEVLADLAALEPLAGVAPRYFELLTAAAFRWFADVAVDVAVVEVGLLGRYDATNVVRRRRRRRHQRRPRPHRLRGRLARRRSPRRRPASSSRRSTLVLGETDAELRADLRPAGAAEVVERDVDFGCERNDLAVGGRLLDLRTPPATLRGPASCRSTARTRATTRRVALAAAEAFFGTPPRRRGRRARPSASVAIPGRFEVVRPRSARRARRRAQPRRRGRRGGDARRGLRRRRRARSSSSGMLQRPRPGGDARGARASSAAATRRRVHTPPSPAGAARDEVAAAAQRASVSTSIVEPDVAAPSTRALDAARRGRRRARHRLALRRRRPDALRTSPAIGEHAAGCGRSAAGSLRSLRP